MNILNSRNRSRGSSLFTLLRLTRSLRRRRTTQYDYRCIVIIIKRWFPIVRTMSRILEHLKEFVSLCSLRWGFVVETDLFGWWRTLT